MGNPLYNRWRCERSDQNTSWRHISSVDVAPQKNSCTFVYRIYPNENIVYTGVLHIFHTKNRWDIDNFAREPFFFKNGDLAQRVRAVVFVLGGVAVGRGFELQSDLELVFAEILIYIHVKRASDRPRHREQNFWIRFSPGNMSWKAWIKCCTIPGLPRPLNQSRISCGVETSIDSSSPWPILKYSLPETYSNKTTWVWFQSEENPPQI
jgi:hypothetical protein